MNAPRFQPAAVRQHLRRRVVASRARARIAVPLAVLAVVSVGVALAWPTSPPVAQAASPELHLFDPVDPPDGPVRIAGVSGGVTWSDRGSSVAVDLTNQRSGRPVVARVWWLLADPRSSAPWEAPAAEGRHVEVTLAPGRTTRVEVPATGDVPPGAWSLSLWAHSVSGGESTHSHGVGVGPLVTVLPTDPQVRRISEPDGRAALTVVEPVGRLVTGEPGDAAVGPDALLSLRATTQQPVQVQVRCYLAEPGTAEPWKHDTAVASTAREVELAGQEPQVSSCSFDRLPGAGVWELSAFVRRGGEGAAGRHEDGLYSRRTVRLAGDCAGALPGYSGRCAADVAAAAR